MTKSSLKNCPVAGNVQRWSAIRSFLLCNSATRRPGSALQNACKWHGRAPADSVLHEPGEPVEQRDRERAPFADYLAIHGERLAQQRRIARGQHAGIDEQAAVAILRKPGE